MASKKLHKKESKKGEHTHKAQPEREKKPTQKPTQKHVCVSAFLGRTHREQETKTKTFLQGNKERLDGFDWLPRKNTKIDSLA